MTAPRPRTVAVALSGGVDSAVAAGLCVRAGHRVVGIMLRLWSEPGGPGNKCCTLGAIDDAAAVADRLGIPFHVLDARDVFKAAIVDAFAAASAAGTTPNPCVACNRSVRFGFLLDQATAVGADVLATGHYARIEPDHDGTLRLLRGVDRDKDQSYVLHRLDQARLARALFPVGARRKAEVRALAAEMGLAVASRADSVDLCWVGEGGVGGFLSRSLPAEALAPGPIVDRSGRVLGEHRGLARYTLGQRRGLGVAAGAPRYVVAKDAARNALVVGPASSLDGTTVSARDWHWVAGAPPPGDSWRVKIQARYRADAIGATLEPGPDGTATCVLDAPVRAATPGQALVAYREDVCLGGGVIAGARGG